MRIEGKVAVVTGGGSGVGRAAVRLLAECGAAVVVVDVVEETGLACAEEVAGVFVRADVGEPSDWERVLEVATDRFGGVDIAYLNAGVGSRPAADAWDNDIAHLTDEQYRRVMRANVDGVVFGVRAVVPSMRRRGGGAIVATSSLAGLMGWPPDPIYTVSKHAVVGLTRSVAPGLSRERITVNAVCPGMVDTPLVPAMLGSDATERLRGQGFPLLQAADVARTVRSLVEGEETGQVIVVQPGREPEPFRFGRVPGPRTGGRAVRPPADMSSGQ